MEPVDGNLPPRAAVIPLALGSAAIVLTSVLYLRAGAPSTGDSCSHFAEIMIVASNLKQGQTDFWFPGGNLGYPLFTGYPPLPAATMGAVVAATEFFIDPLFLFKLSIIGLLALLLPSWYLGGRWLGLDRLQALSFSLLILLVRDFTETGLGPAGILGKGLYTQLWATVLAPLSIGSLYRYLHRRDIPYAVPVLLLSVTILSHLFVGYLCGVAGILLATVSFREVKVRLLRFAAVSGVAAFLIGFWLVPFLANQSWLAGIPVPNERFDGYGLPKMAAALFAGELFDAQRVAVVSLLALLGLLLRPRAEDVVVVRTFAALAVLCLTLALGPATWGEGYRKLPLHGSMEVYRYVAGLQLAGLYFAARGAAAVARLLLQIALRNPRIGKEPVRGRTVAVLVGAAFTLVLVQRLFILHGSLKVFDPKHPDFSRLVEEVSRGEGRFVCDKRLQTGDPIHYNLLPTLARRPQLQSYGRGYLDTPSVYPVVNFSFRPEELRLFNVRHLIALAPLQSTSGLGKPWNRGDYHLYEVDGESGYFDFVQVPCVISARTFNEVRETSRRMALFLYARGQLPRIQFDPGSPPGPRVEQISPDQCRLTIDGKTVVPSGKPEFVAAKLLSLAPPGPRSRSRLHDEQVRTNEYRVTADVPAGPSETLLLKVSHHPYWSATVDDQPVRIEAMAPGLMAVEVPPGSHEVRFRFRNPTWQKGWVLISGLLAAALAIVPQRERLVRLLRQGGAPSSAPPNPPT